MHRIVVLGAGYAGAHAAGRLARRLSAADTQITVVNAEPDFVERIRMHQVATGQDLRRRPLAEVFAGTHITLRTARVAAVDAERKEVALEGGDVVGFDTLVYGLGSTAAGSPAFHVASRPAALRVRARLQELAAGATVLVVGGGLTGIETATEIAERRPDLRVAMASRGEPGAWLSDKARAHLRRAFDRFGITVHLSEVPADLTVWTAGFAVHPIAAASGLTVDEAGRIVVDGTMRSVSHPDVYAVGDAALAPGFGGKPLRMSCASGTPAAWQAADAIAARLTGRPVREKPVGYLAQAISLGRRDGIVQLVTPDDRIRSTVLTGRTAGRIKEFIVAGAGWGVHHPTVLLPSRRRRLAGPRKHSDRPAGVR